VACTLTCPLPHSRKRVDSPAIPRRSSGTLFAMHLQRKKERAIRTGDNASGMRISNWTLATNTQPGERCIDVTPSHPPVRNTR